MESPTMRLIETLYHTLFSAAFAGLAVGALYFR